jgi:hypothetical protein
MVRAVAISLWTSFICARIVPQTSIKKASSDTKGCFYSPAPSLVAVVRSFYKHMRKRAFSNLHSIAALRIASHATSQCVCLRVHACEYTCVPSLNDCELQFGVGVVQCEFMLQNRARNPKLRPSADGHRSDSLTYEPE